MAGMFRHTRCIHTDMQIDTTTRERAIYRVTLAGSTCNLLLTLFKFLAGIFGHSAAMLADAVHSLSDLITDAVVLIFVRIAGKPQDRKHEFGHGKYETLGTVIIGLLLFLVGVGICWNGTVLVWQYCHGQTLYAPEPIALYAALASIVIKEALYWYTVSCGHRFRSPAVVANAWHHRSDAFSSAGTAAGIGGAILLGPQWAVLDPIAAIIVSGFIIKVSLELVSSGLNELLEHSLPEEEEKFIIDTILSYPGVSDPHHLRTRSISHYCAIEMHFRMDGNTTLYEAHHATSVIENKLRAHFGPTTIINSHVEPVKRTPNENIHEVPAESSRQGTQMPEQDYSHTSDGRKDNKVT